MVTAVGRVVRWDESHERGAVIVEGLPVELAVPLKVVNAPGGRMLETGELVEIAYEVGPDGHYVVHRACPTDEGD